jgi:hypothetical protein
MLTVRNQIISSEAAAKASLASSEASAKAARAAEETAAKAHRMAEEAAAKAARKRHTLDILIAMRQNPIFNIHRDNLYSHFPFGTPLTDEDVAKANREIAEKREYSLDVTPRVGESLRYVTNYYEFLCAALRQGDLDEALIKQSLRQIMVGYEEKVGVFIKDMVAKHGEKTYEHFLTVVSPWKQELAAEAKVRQQGAGAGAVQQTAP